jgi:hypothetical protein
MNDEQEDAFQGWAKLLNPKELRSNLVCASVYLTAYEFLRQALIEHLEGFFADRFGASGPILGKDYREKVLSLHKKPFFASANWFRNCGALTDANLERIREIREHRNFVAHNVLEAVGSVKSSVRKDLLYAIAEIVRKIDVWWIREIELPTNPDFDTDTLEQVDVEGIYSLRMAVLGLLLQVADGNDEALKQLYENLNTAGAVH